MVTDRFIRTARQQAKKPLPTRRALLGYLAFWSIFALGNAVTVGLLIGKSLWHTPFASQTISKWTPIFLLITGVVQAQTYLQRVLDGAYRGGELDPNNGKAS